MKTWSSEPLPWRKLLQRSLSLVSQTKFSILGFTDLAFASTSSEIENPIQFMFSKILQWNPMSPCMMKVLGSNYTGVPPSMSFICPSLSFYGPCALCYLSDSGPSGPNVMRKFAI